VESEMMDIRKFGRATKRTTGPTIVRIKRKRKRVFF